MTKPIQAKRYNIYNGISQGCCSKVKSKHKQFPLTNTLNTHTRTHTHHLTHTHTHTHPVPLSHSHTFTQSLFHTLKYKDTSNPSMFSSNFKMTSQRQPINLTPSFWTLCINRFSKFFSCSMSSKLLVFQWLMLPGLM